MIDDDDELIHTTCVEGVLCEVVMREKRGEKEEEGSLGRKRGRFILRKYLTERTVRNVQPTAAPEGPRQCTDLLL